MAKSIKYSHFTPPWIRLNLSVSVRTAATNDTEIEAFSENVTLKRACVTDLRKERNTQGYRRLRFILAAFHSQEPDAVRPLLNHLLRIVPACRAEVPRKIKNMKRKSNNGSTNKSVGGVDLHEEQNIKIVKTSDISNSTNVHRANNENGFEGSQDRGDQSDSRPPQLLRQLLSRSPDTSKDASPSQPSVTPRDVSKTREKWCNRTQRNTDGQGRKTVFGDLMKRASDSPLLSDGDKIQLPNSATNLHENREHRNADSKNNPEMPSQGLERTRNECSKGNQESQLHRSDTELRSPLTPFSDVDIHEDVNGSEEELETDPYSGIIKCGLLAQCHWFLTTQMQDH